MIKKFTTIYFLFVCVISIAQINQYGYPLFTYYDAKDYDAYDQFWDIVEDGNGLIYAANNFDGILQFDGVEWRKLQIEGNPEVRNLALDTDGIIYVGCSGDFGYVRPEINGKLKYISLKEKYNSDSSNFSFIHKVNIIGDSVYYSSDNSILFTYLKSNDSIIITKLPDYSLFTFKINEQLYGSSYLNGLYKLSNKKIDFISGGSFYKSKNIFSILPDSNNFNIVTGNKGIFNYNEKTGVSTQKLSAAAKGYLKNFITYDAEKYENDILLSTIGSGVVHCNTEGEIVNVFDNAIGLKDHMCASVDSYRNSMWCALAIGISRFELNSPFRYFSKESELEGFIIDIAEYRKNLYVATELGLFRQVVKGIEYPVFEKLSDIDNKQTTSMIKIKIKDGAEKLIVGTTDGVHQLNSRGDKLELIEENLLGKEKYSNIDVNQAKDQNTTENLYVMKLFQGQADNVIYIGTKSRIISLEFSNNKWKVNQVFNIGDGIDNFEQDVDGTIWAATKQKGLVKINIQNNQIEKLDTASGLPVNYSLKLLKIKDELLCATPKGIYLYNNDENKFELDSRFPEKYLSKQTGTFKSLIDKDNNIYINYYSDKEKGIDKLLWNNNDNKYYIQEDFKRLGNVEANFFYEYKNAIWFGVSDVLYSYNKNTVVNYSQPYKCLVRKVEGVDSAYFYGAFYNESKLGLVPSNIQHDKQKPFLEYSQNDITFHFAAPYFEGLEAIEYSYKLIGFKSGWSKWNTESKAVFTNLNEGKYTFQVKAKNIYGIESEIGQFEFTIMPPWYRTIVAFIIYFILVIFIIWVILKLYTRRLQMEKIRLEGIVLERTAEIREQKEEIEKQKEEITASIHYAQRIQKAIVPSEERAAEVLRDLMVLWNPRDIVSGDFWWMGEQDDYIVVTAADCTGHGVPGAFMSMLGVSFLNEIVKQQGITESHEILNRLRDKVKTTLGQTDKGSTNKDGMDIALLVIDFDKMKAQFSGAYNPLFLYRKGELLETKATRNPIGVYIKEKPFEQHLIDLQKGDVLYMFSDGFPDQFGGEKEKKYSTKRFKELLLEIHTKPMDEQKEILNKELLEWRGPIEQIDDVIILGIRI